MISPLQFHIVYFSVYSFSPVLSFAICQKNRLGNGALGGVGPLSGLHALVPDVRKLFRVFPWHLASCMLYSCELFEVCQAVSG